MVKQGDIIKINLNPTKGHEQSGYRPALILSNDDFMYYTRLAIVCPISNANNHFPLHIALDERTKTTGNILCEHLRTLDINSRGYNYIESLPKDILENVLKIINAEF